MGVEIGGRHIPSRETWAKTTKIVGTTLSPRDVDRLYAAVVDRDMTVMLVNGIPERLLKVVTMDVFYQSGDHRYRLKESRFTIKPDHDANEVLEQVLVGDLSGVTPSRSRPDRNSLSERIKLTGESREHATVRALHEEMFDFALERAKRKNSPKEYPDLDVLIEANLRYGDYHVVHVNEDDEGSSFPGIRARYFLFPASITFTPDMDVPIDVTEGVPQPLYEYAEEKYINRYDWVQVD